MAHAFISYSHENEDEAFALDRQLTRYGIPTYIDSDSLGAGDEWRPKLKNALDEAFVLLVVCTDSSMKSLEVCFEWSYAMGRGIPVIPLIFDGACQLHSRLQSLQYLNFSGRDRPWAKLRDSLKEIMAAYEPKVWLPKKSGIVGITLSRDELLEHYSIKGILGQLQLNSELIVVARSCEAWSREWEQIQRAVNERSVRVRLAVVNPALTIEQWMIKDDYAQFDIKPTIERLNLIAYKPESKGKLELRLLPGSPLFSFICFEGTNGRRTGILEAGASLNLSERVSLILQSSETEEAILLDRLLLMYSRVLDSAPVAFELGIHP